MKIVADAYIPFLVEAVHVAWPDVDICPLKPEQIDAQVVRDADVLVVRTRTQVNAALLAASRVRLVCTATIGYDHIDTAWCETHGIRWTSCPGCNAQAVCDYIEEALDEWHQSDVTVGVVGVGHVGSKVAAMAERKGYRVLLNDPPKGIGVSLDEIAAKSDVVTFHVPLDKTTYHLCDEAFLRKCRPGSLIINAARGGVVDEQALWHSGHPYILDTWEGEPDISPEILRHAFLASMHIAGYSWEGKRNAAQMCLDAIAHTFGLPVIDLSAIQGRKPAKPESGWLAALTAQLKAAPEQFEYLRKNYPLR